MLSRSFRPLITVRTKSHGGMCGRQVLANNKLLRIGRILVGRGRKFRKSDYLGDRIC